MSELISLEKVSFDAPVCRDYAREEIEYVNILTDISFKINKGEFCVITGATGSGKSSLLRLLKKELTTKGHRKGKILWKGTKLEELSEKEMSCKVGFVGQNPEHQCVTDKVWHELAFGLENMGISQSEIRRRVAEAAAYFDMEDLYYRETDSLSGGEKQLLNLASVLIMRPEIIVLDEPTSQLDPIASQRFINTLVKINRELGITVLIAEHRIGDVICEVNHILVMENGRLAFDTDVSSIGNDEIYWNLPGCVREALPCYIRLFKETKGEGCVPFSITEGREYFEKIYTQRGLNISAKETGGLEKEKLLSAKSLCFSYSKKGQQILNDFSVNLYKGEIFFILGGNGSGKTTAIKAMAGILRPQSGKVISKAKIAMLPQDVETFFVKDSVGEELDLCGDAIKNHEDIMGFLNGKRDVHPYDLSGGEKQLLAFARLLSLEADILLLDEPTKGLDHDNKAKIIQLIQSLRNEGKSIVIVSHDKDVAAECADRCAFFFRGEIVSEAYPVEFFENNTFYATEATLISRGIADGIISTKQLINLVKDNNA